jgi:hypothetical protein
MIISPFSFWRPDASWTVLGLVAFLGGAATKRNETKRFLNRIEHPETDRQQAKATSAKRIVRR